MTTTRVLLIAPALSTALREARFGEAEGAERTDGAERAEAGDPGPGVDGGLDPVGLRQAEAVRESFPRASRLYVSSTRRCRTTARALGLDAGTAPPLTGPAPCAMGRWQGRTLDEVAASEPEAV
ncbi:histidine phosphatase family protein, partial [Streptomyces sp. SID3212]|uniref:histidine phosphatase family protein n=1 Tax=Streptomyces sp. SID3212 TaxID=2690259 RepID=UPI00136CD376